MKPEEAKKILDQAEEIKKDEILMKKIKKLPKEGKPESIDDLRKLREAANNQPDIKLSVHVNTSQNVEGSGESLLTEEDKAALQDEDNLDKLNDGQFGDLKG